MGLRVICRSAEEQGGNIGILYPVSFGQYIKALRNKAVLSSEMASGGGP